MLSSETLACRVCGLALLEPPWGNDGRTPTYDICGCCGVEFGYEDCTAESTRRYRQAWMHAGCQWFDPGARPSGWDFVGQLEKIPSAFRLG